VLTIGFIGAGLMGWAHSFGLQIMIEAGIIDASIVAVHDPDRFRAIQFGEANGAAVMANVDDVLDRCEVVWVCTPTATHESIVEAAVERGRAVFCEKPLATSLAGAETMARAVAKAGAQAQVGLVLRSSPVFGMLGDVLASGELGRPMAAVLRDDQYFPVQGAYASTWRSDVELAGGGCLLEHSIHDADILRVLFGQVTEVSCRTANFAGHRGIEDLAVVSMQFDSGTTAEIVSVWHEILSRGSNRRLEVICQRGMAWLENEFAGPLHIETSDGVEVRPCPPPAWIGDLPIGDDKIGNTLGAYIEADRAFLDAVSSGTAPEPSFPEALSAHRIVDGAYRSAALGGSPIALSDP
jgi:predicted dehydrogenase